MDVNPSTIASSSSPSQNPDSEITAIGFQFIGPLPTPGMLEDFDRVVPGLARKIVDRSELELHHRHKVEELALTARIEDRRAARRLSQQGQWMAFVLAVLFSGLGVYLVLNGYPKVGGAMATTTVVALAGVFLTGQLKRPKQNIKDQKEDTK